MNRPAIVVIGCGPGAAEHITPAAREAAASAEALAGSPRLLAQFAEHPGEKMAVDAKIGPLLDRLDALVQAGRSVAVLVSGDPGLCSLAESVVRRFGRENCRLVPGVSSVQAAFARIGLSWSDAHILSAHGRTPALGERELAAEDKIAILAGTVEGLRWAADAAASLGESHAAWLCEDLTLPGERVRETTAEELRRGEASSLSIVLLIRRTLLT